MLTVALVIHFIGLAMGVGTGIGFIFLGMAASKMEKSEALKFTMNAMALSRMGNTGIILLILSGLYMITPYWAHLASYPYLIVKLCLVLVLVTLILTLDRLTAKAKKSEDPLPYLKKIKSISPFSLLTAIAIITMAVMTFH